MISDSRLQHDVIAELEWEPGVDHSDIGVAVHDGVVSLSGCVKNYAQKMAAEKAIRRVAGVKALAEDITVCFPNDPQVPDHEIARRIIDIFAWDVTIPADTIQVKVEHGWVTLTGTIDSFYQGDSARKAAGKVRGVIGISNLTEVRAVPCCTDIRDRIVAALERNAYLDSGSITVVPDGCTVRLGGRVHAWRERDIAERAAWAAPGVNKVENNIVVAF